MESGEGELDDERLFMPSRRREGLLPVHGVVDGSSRREDSDVMRQRVNQIYLKTYRSEVTDEADDPPQATDQTRLD